jgi:GxxExxY protein
MDTDAHGLETNLTEAVIGSAFEVSKALGAGFLEKVYERAMLRELTLRGVSAKTQASFPLSSGPGRRRQRGKNTSRPACSVKNNLHLECFLIF